MRSLLRPGLISTFVIAAMVGLWSPAFAASGKPPATVPCTSATGSAMPTKPIFKLTGLYALPKKAPTTLIVFAHGYRNDSSSWKNHIVDTATKHGAIAVAVDYTGLGTDRNHRGWPAKAGAADLVTAAKYFVKTCPKVTQVLLLGVSMGGNMSGLAVASKATRPNGQPLFDYWVDVEGATNVTETYLEATAVGPGNAYAAGAAQDISAEMGGSPATNPQAYQDRTVVLHAADIAASKIKGVVIVHAVADGLVPFDQSAEMALGLTQNKVPTDVYAVARKDTNEGQTTLEGTVLGPAGLSSDDPMAGHGWEGSDTDVVIMTGLTELWNLAAGGPAPSNKQFLVDSPPRITQLP